MITPIRVKRFRLRSWRKKFICYGETWVWKWSLFHFMSFRRSSITNSNAWTAMMVSHTKYFSKSINISCANLMEEFKPVIREIFEFGSRDLLILRPLWQPRTIRSPRQRTMWNLFKKELSIRKKKPVIEILKQEIHWVVLLNYELDYRKIVNTRSSCLAFWNHKNSKPRSKNSELQFKTPLLLKVSPIRTRW